MIAKPHESMTFDSREFQKLRLLVASGEGQQLEFKRKVNYPEKILREMVAFANTDGGVLLVGVNDDGSIPGLKYPDGEAHVISVALKQCRPALRITERYISIGNARWVIQYTIPESRKKLHYLIGTDKTKEAFVRVADQSIKASREIREITRQARRKNGVRFHYGEHEEFLMKYLDEKGSITLHEFIKLRNIRRFIASKKLVRLVLADVLSVTPHEKGDVYARTQSHT